MRETFNADYAGRRAYRKAEMARFFDSISRVVPRDEQVVTTKLFITSTCELGNTCCPISLGKTLGGALQNKEAWHEVEQSFSWFSFAPSN